MDAAQSKLIMLATMEWLNVRPTALRFRYVLGTTD
jgi:hypothetical protein